MIIFKLFGLLQSSALNKTLVFAVFSLIVSSVLEFVFVINLPIILELNRTGSIGSDPIGVLKYLSNSLNLNTINILFIISFIITVLISFISLALIFRLGANHGINFADRLFFSFIDQNFDAQTKTQKSQIQNLLTVEINRVIDGIILPLAQAFGRGVSCISILAALMVLNWKMTCLFLLLLSLTYSLLFLVQIKIVVKSGASLTVTNKARAIQISSFFYDLKNNLIQNKSLDILETVELNSKEWATSKSTLQTMGIVPRYFVDTLLIAGVIIITLNFSSSDDAETLFNTMGLSAAFIYAILKVIPFVQQLYLASVSVLGALTSAEILVNELEKMQVNKLIKPPFEMLKQNIQKIDISNLFHVPLNKKINLQILNGKINVITGKSGVGKTWLVDTLVGLRPNMGIIKCYAKASNAIIEIDDLKPLGVAYVEQEVLFPQITICRFVTGMNFDMLDNAQVLRYEKALRLAQLSNGDGIDLRGDTLVAEGGSTISGGQKRRVCIARALYTPGQVLVLDEPTAGLDTKLGDELISVLHSIAQEKMVICISHNQKIIQSDVNLIKL